MSSLSEVSEQAVNTERLLYHCLGVLLYIYASCKIQFLLLQICQVLSMSAIGNQGAKIGQAVVILSRVIQTCPKKIFDAQD